MIKLDQKQSNTFMLNKPIYRRKWRTDIALPLSLPCSCSESTDPAPLEDLLS